MKLGKAIELNKDVVESLKDGKRPDHADAVKLGNEAIYRLQDYRLGIDTPFDEPLPGETEG